MYVWWLWVWRLSCVCMCMPHSVLICINPFSVERSIHNVSLRSLIPSRVFCFVLSRCQYQVQSHHKKGLLNWCPKQHQHKSLIFNKSKTLFPFPVVEFMLMPNNWWLQYNIDSVFVIIVRLWFVHGISVVKSIEHWNSKAVLLRRIKL